MKKYAITLMALSTAAALTMSAYALDYSIGAVENTGYGRPTTIELVHTPDDIPKSEDISKNAALIPPGFGSPASNLPGSGSPLTPDLAPGSMAAMGAVINGSVVTVLPPSIPALIETAGADGNTAVVPPAPVETVPEAPVEEVPPAPSPTGRTEVTEDLYYSNGSLGTLEIPAIGLSVGVYEGTGSAPLLKGAGHFTDTSIWDGTVGLAGHNRGVTNHFGKIHTLAVGDTITLTTQLGIRTYGVTSVTKVAETDRSALASTNGNRIVLYTCVMNQREYRWCVEASEIV